MKSELIKLLVIVLLSFGLGFLLARVTKKCQVPSTEIVYVHDTITHTINNDYHHYHESVLVDTVELPTNIDTNKILQNYFNKYAYNREWNDSNLIVNLNDVVTQNRFENSKFSYQLLKPQTIITNTTNITNYSKYLTLNLRVPITPEFNKDFEIGLQYQMKKMNLGVWVEPYSKTFSVSGGVTLFKFK
jgi:hypothetical protein